MTPEALAYWSAAPLTIFVVVFFFTKSFEKLIAGISYMYYYELLLWSRPRALLMPPKAVCDADPTPEFPTVCWIAGVEVTFETTPEVLLEAGRIFLMFSRLITGTEPRCS